LNRRGNVEEERVYGDEREYRERGECEDKREY
jgi:hypothetical protein